VLTKIVKGFKGLFGLLIPVFARGAERSASPGIRWALHIALVVLTLIGLSIAQWFFRLEQFAYQLPQPLPRIWLPALFLLLYLIGWLIWWFWTLLRAAPEASPFPDIDRAWDEAKLALTEANLNLSEIPLFLLLGRPEAGEEGLFESVPLTVQQSPRRPEAPLHLYANKDAIYLTCVGASLLGEQSRVLAGEVLLGSPTQPAGEPTENGGETLRPDQINPEVNLAVATSKEIRAIEEGARAEGRGPGSLTRTELLSIKRLRRSLTRVVRAQLLHNDTERVELLRARLRHLCQLIARGRRPFCGINGVLALVPMAATDDDQDAHETGTCLKEDLEDIRDSLQVQCPVFTLICGLEQLPGFEKFVGKVPPDQLRRRVGQRLPLIPDVSIERIPKLIEDAVKWLGLKMMPSLALPSWSLETPGVVSFSESVEANTELFQFLSEVRDRHARASHILSVGVTGQLLGGGYIAATGRNSEREQAFLRPVFARLTEEQDYVSWTPEAIAEEDAYRRTTRFGYIVLAIILAVEAGILLFNYLPRR
jgi:hypothetical protein